MNRIEGHPSQKVSLSNTKISTTSETFAFAKTPLQIKNINRNWKLMPKITKYLKTKYYHSIQAKTQQYVKKSLIYIKNSSKTHKTFQTIGKSMLTAFSNRTLSYNIQIKQHPRNEQASIQYDLQNNHANNQTLEISISKHKI
ncbi:Hypothetical_protein [Hexamita inflata]|uniref:Hypothetical_protein n=1 Tax=Hexamita inflata TaxID=28002 RepID=A0AA86PKC1_9EUKA|nr:Hypothetical protein HINF_LOCUS28849 [Hexamita inflata]